MSFLGTIRELDRLEISYLNLLRLAGREPPLDPDSPIQVEKCKPGCGFVDRFHEELEKHISHWAFMLPKIRKAQADLYESSFRFMVKVDRNDPGNALIQKRHFGFDPADGDAAPPAQLHLMWFYEALDAVLTANFEANKASMFNAKPTK